MEVGENGLNGQSAMLNVPKQEENKREHEMATTQLQAMEERIAPDKTRKKRATKSNVPATARTSADYRPTTATSQAVYANYTTADGPGHVTDG